MPTTLNVNKNVAVNQHSTFFRTVWLFLLFAYTPLSRLAQTPSLSVTSIRESICCPRSVCHREHKLFSLGHGDSMIWVYKQAYQAGIWHLAVLFPSSSLALSPSHRQTYCTSLSHTHTHTVSLPLSLSHTNIHTLWEFASSLWGGLFLPWESQPSSFDPESPEMWLILN